MSFNKNEMMDSYIFEIEDPDSTPNVCVFSNELRKEMNDIVNELKRKYKLIDINQLIIAKSEDYHQPAKNVGIITNNDDTSLDDVFICDDRKYNLIVRAKLSDLEKIVDNKTILLITYNDSIINNEVVYEEIRYWLKNGYVFNGRFSKIHLNALILTEKIDRIRDFCQYGIFYKKNQ